jgi:mercuric ion binding protein
MKTQILLLFFALASDVALAATRTVRLDVQNMTCAICPLTVKKALEHVPGILQVTVDYASKTAMVEFDDATAIPDQLTEATKTAGYPSSVIKEDKK